MDQNILALGLMQYVCLLFSLCVHEAAHAAMANHCGDPTARLLGRLSLDPRKHIDPLGTFLFPLLNIFTGLVPFGWAKPVPINPRNLHNMRRDQVLIALAGPASNVLIALAAIFVLRIFILLSGAGIDNQTVHFIGTFFVMLMLINVGLAVFNMLPVPPLDGHYLLRYFLPYNAAAALDRIGPFGIILAFMLARPWLSVTLPIVYKGIGKLLGGEI